MVNEDQKEMGRMSARLAHGADRARSPATSSKCAALPGNSVDRDRHVGFREVMEAAPNKFNITEVVGNWDTGTSQKVTADALAVHGHFDGVFTQGGSDGTVQAMMDAKHPFVPMSGEGENEFRKQIAEHSKDGLKGMSYGQSPALVAIAIKAAISALQGNVMPQLISIPIPVADLQGPEGRRELLARPQGQFLRRQSVPAVRRRTSRRRRSWRRARRTRSDRLRRTAGWPGVAPGHHLVGARIGATLKV